MCHFCGPELLDPVLRCNSGRSRSNVLLPYRRTPTEKATARCQLVCNATRHLGKPPVEQIVREVRDHWRDRYYLTAPYPSCCFNFLFFPLQIAGLSIFWPHQFFFGALSFSFASEWSLITYSRLWAGSRISGRRKHKPASLPRYSFALSLSLPSSLTHTVHFQCTVIITSEGKF